MSSGGATWRHFGDVVAGEVEEKIGGSTAATRARARGRTSRCLSKLLMTSLPAAFSNNGELLRATRESGRRFAAETDSPLTLWWPAHEADGLLCSRQARRAALGRVVWWVGPKVGAPQSGRRGMIRFYRGMKT